MLTPPPPGEVGAPTLGIATTLPLRREGREKLTGEAKYTDDLVVPGAWYGAAIRSTEAHARLLGLEQATPLEALDADAGLAPRAALPYPQIALSETQATRVRQGQRPSLRAEGRVVLIDPAGALVAVAEVLEGRTRLLRVWS